MSGANVSMRVFVPKEDFLSIYFNSKEACDNFGVFSL